MPIKVELTVSSLICMLISVQVFVSISVVATMAYMYQMYPGQFQVMAESQVNLSPSRGGGYRQHSNSFWPMDEKDEPGNYRAKNTQLVRKAGIEIAKFAKLGKLQEQELKRSKLQTKNSNDGPLLMEKAKREEPALVEEENPAEVNKFVILTSVNSAFLDIAENWLESLRRLGLRYNITVVCEDIDAYTYFTIRSNEEFHVLYQKQYEFNFTRRYHPRMLYQELIRRRTVYIRTLLEQGLDVLLVDTDTVWIKNPLNLILDEYLSYDIWLAQGYDSSLPCPCFMYMKAVPNVVAMVRKWVSRLENHDSKRMESDQVALRFVLPQYSDIPIKRLSFEQFPTGKHYFDPDWLAVHKDEVYVAHGNHLGRHDGKKKMFREFGIWLLNS